MTELENAQLLERKRRGLGLANIIYLKKFIGENMDALHRKPIHAEIEIQEA